MIGIANNFRLAADVAVASSTTLVDLPGLSFPLAPGQKCIFTAVIPVTVGATGGIKLRVAASAAVADFVQTVQLNDVQTPGVTNAVYATPTDFANALAGAGSNYIVVRGSIENDAADNVISFQGAQNSAANTTTFLAGSFLQVVYL